MKYILLMLSVLSVSGCALFDRNDKELDNARQTFSQYCEVPVQVRELAPQAAYDAVERLNTGCGR